MDISSKNRSLWIVLSCLAVVAIGAGVIALYARDEPVAKQTAAVAGEKEQKDVLQSTLAGTWYTADGDRLREEIAGYLAKAPVEPKKDIVALVLPHAGYAYSGPTAAYGIQSLGRAYKRVVVIGPTHHLPMEDTFSVSRATHCETPLGEVALDVEFARKLLQYPMFQDIPVAHEQEHSVQIEVPLLQYKLGAFKLVPIVAGQCSAQTAAQAGRVLASLIDSDTLVVASSDFTHYGPRYQYTPFKENIPDNVKKLDLDAFEFIRKLDGKGLLEYRDQTHVTICGCVPVAVLLEMLDKSTQVDMLRHTNSGESTGDFSNFVGYMAIAFHGAWGTSSSPAPVSGQATLTAEDKKQLLALVRNTLRYALDHQMMPEPSDLAFTASESTKAPRAAFVTLKKDGQLRGCVGDIFPQRPLYKSVIGNAIYAAFGDRRFQPLRSDEYDRIKVEISALTAPTPVATPQEIRIGIDGVVLNKDGRSAVFLPQVATEQGWNLETTLQHLSMKAGLPADAWKQGASFLVFQADVFGEEL